MSNFYLFLIIIGLCIPGICLMSNHTVKSISAKPDNKMSKQSLYIMIAVQTLVIVAISAAAGVYLGPKVGLTDPFLEGLSHGQFIGSNLYRQLSVGAVGGAVCSAAWLLSYYGYIRPRLDRQSVLVSERLRHQLGLSTRMMSGGIVEEVIFRWGLLTLVMWLLTLLSVSASAAFWIGIVASGTLFGLAHLPGYLEEGCKPSVMLIVTSIFGNLWVSLFCGYLFWQYGLVAAILVHILFHVIWYPWDQAAYKKLNGLDSAG